MKMRGFHRFGKMKKVSAACMAALFLACFCTAFAVQAAPIASSSDKGGATQAKALAWLAQNRGKSIDFDGAYGAQNTDLIKAYYDYLGAASAAGNAAAYRFNDLPEGFLRIPEGEPLPGDILIYTGGYYGHVGIYESDHVTWHQGFGTDTVIRLLNDYREIGGDLTYWGLIRPVFAGGQPAAAKDTESRLKGKEIFLPGKLPQGIGFAAGGTVTDAEAIKNVTAGVYLPDGQEISSVSAEPNAASFNLANLPDELKLDALSSGVYEYRVTAADSRGTMVLASEVFIITARSRTIPDGLYKMSSNLGGSHMISVAGRSVLPGANIRLFRYLSYDQSQDFYFTYKTDGYYTAKNRKTGQFLTVRELKADGWADVVQEPENGGDGQLFQVLTDGADSWYLVPKAEGSLLVRVADGLAYDTANVDAGPASLGEDCRFTFYDAFSGFRDVQGEARGQ